MDGEFLSRAIDIILVGVVIETAVLMIWLTHRRAFDVALLTLLFLVSGLFLLAATQAAINNSSAQNVALLLLISGLLHIVWLIRALSMTDRKDDTMRR